MPQMHGRERWIGTVFALLSTTFYGTSNVTMRYLVGVNADPDWILFYKELIGVLILLPWLLFRFFQGRLFYISKRLIWYVLFASVLCQLIGSHLQLLGYAVIGLVITVPLIQSAQLLGVALFGFYFLGDPLSSRRKFAIGVLIAAVTILSIGKTLAQVPTVSIPAVNTYQFILVALGTVIGGVSFAIYTIILRYVIRRYWKDENSPWKSFSLRHWAGAAQNELVRSESNHRFYSPFPVTFVMMIVLTTGAVIFGLCLYFKQGVAGFYTVSSSAWYLIPISAVCNTAGFFFQVQCLRMTTAVQAALVAVAQIVILSFVGYLCFEETINTIVALGVVLTAYGVMMSAKPEK